MQWEQILQHLAAEAKAISAAPVSFAAAILVVSGIVFLIARWSYSTVIAHKDARIGALEERVKLRDDQLSNKFQSTTADEARELMAALQTQVAQLTPRRLPKQDRQALLDILRAPAGTDWAIEISWDAPTPDAEGFARDFRALFDEAGWSVYEAREFDSDIPSGVTLTMPNPDNSAGKTAERLFRRAGMPFKTVSGRPNLVTPHIQIGPRDD